jgi:flavin reductase (DIM6/NTAB) family NADH-FMN oxidoreductase RutF
MTRLIEDWWPMSETVASDVLSPVDPRALRSVLGRFATGVAVVTTTSPDGQPVGMTVNSFTSVSLDPPLVLFCVNRDSQLRPVFANADAFVVNVLRESQKELSRRFARPGLDRFGTRRPVPGRSGAPLLDSPLAAIECHTDRVVAAGDHDVVIGRVVAMHAPSDDGPPLVYYGGAYRSLDADSMDWWTAFS